MLEKAIILATHKGKKDKGGACYILHALRVMLCFEKEEQQIVAVLHDVLEDTEISEEYLQNVGFHKNIIEAVVCLTKKQCENYFDYIERVKQNDIARMVKLADLQDNMNLKRIKNTQPQSLLNAEQRKQNLKGAFALENNQEIDGKTILLIDDIFTTGTTVNECAKILYHNGAKKVLFFALCVAEGE